MIVKSIAFDESQLDGFVVMKVTGDKGETFEMHVKSGVKTQVKQGEISNTVLVTVTIPVRQLTAKSKQLDILDNTQQQEAS